jgi:murein DD-endopeptidase MepM/ murein hydrolase activator NlpD
MTETIRRFPVAARAAIVALVLSLLSVVATVAGAAPPSRQDIQRAKDRLERIEGELGRIRDQLAGTQERLNEAAGRVEQQQIVLEEVTTELVRTQAELDRAKARYDRIVDRLNERAVNAYMTGPASSLDFLLGAQDVADLTDRLAYVDALAQVDAELAVKVANLKNRLRAFESQLERQQELEVKALEEARAEKREVASLFDHQRSLLDQQQDLLRSAQRTFKRQKAAYAEWLEEQRAASQGNAIGGRIWDGGSLTPFDHVLQVCPVASPRAFGDGFGAPRYAGGYHLHKGVDIVAPMSAEIYAPFDGQAYTSSNSLGGNVVFVVGALGTVYNAHLSAYSDHSNSAVSAGDVIGYVGSTGSSTTPHDHFEFHPTVFPGPWPISYYGYSVIEDAINPYPLLIQACG